MSGKTTARLGVQHSHPIAQKEQPIMATRTSRRADRPTTVALTAIAGLLGHHGGDYLVQTDCMAQGKQKRTRSGRRQLAAHVATYVATQAVTKALTYRTSGVRVPVRAQLAGALVEGVLHAVIDDGRPLRAFAAATSKLGFHDLHAAGINGRALMDQAAHHQVQILAGAIVTATIADRVA